MLASENDLAIRLLEDSPSDYRLMARWLSDPRVLEHYEGRDQPYDEARIREQYGRRTLDEDGVTPCIIELAGEPIGYVQFFRLDDETLRAYELSSADNAYGFDIFIGEPDCWGRGLGTRAVIMMKRTLFGLGAGVVTADPRVSNPRAVRTYEKAGLEIIRRLPARELHEGAWHDNWLMAAFAAGTAR